MTSERDYFLLGFLLGVVLVGIFFLLAVSSPSQVCRTVHKDAKWVSGRCVLTRSLGEELFNGK